MAPQRAGGGQRFRWSRRLLVVVAGFCISACSTAPRPSRPIVTMDARGAEPAGTAEKTHGASSQADPRGTWKSDPPARQRDPARGDDARVTDEPIASGMADGGFYKDDGPGDRAPEELDRVPEPVPRLERLHARANRPYQIEGQLYIPLRELEPYQAEGLASWYGRRYHGRQTANGEIYDMYALSAAHPLLPLPSFARVTHLANGRAIVVRVNDRGPFIGGREIDLSFAAAHRLGIRTAGSARVRVDLLLPGRDF